MASLKLKNIKKIYGKDTLAVDNFNLEIADKEFVVFVGPSGCGKSTTLRMVAGLEEISDGELYIGEKLVNDVPPKDRDIAMVFQNYALYPHMSVYENMAFSLKLMKLPKKEIETRVKEAAEILGITQYLPRKPRALSGGQRQRVAIGRAIVRNPQVFLMDEPLSNLDAKLRNQMRAELIKLRQRVDTTFIYVTHDQTEAMTLGDRIVIMKDGIIQQIGTPKEVFGFPKNMFVAGFIGSPQMNFFEGKLIPMGQKYGVELFGKEFELSSDKQKAMGIKHLKPQNVMCGIRPEHVIMTDESDPNALRAYVEVSELMGSEMFIHATIEDINCTIKVTNPDILNKYTFELRNRQEIYITFGESRLHVFDIETQNNIGI